MSHVYCHLHGVGYFEPIPEDWRICRDIGSRVDMGGCQNYVHFWVP